MPLRIATGALMSTHPQSEDSVWSAPFVIATLALGVATLLLGWRMLVTRRRFRAPEGEGAGQETEPTHRDLAKPLISGDAFEPDEVDIGRGIALVRDDTIVECNAAFARLCGKLPHEVAGTPLRAWLAPEIAGMNSLRRADGRSLPVEAIGRATPGGMRVVHVRELLSDVKLIS